MNWDFLDYLVSTGSYSGFVTNARAGTQHFMMGTTRVSIAAAIPSFTLAGENATHTCDLAGYTGQDVQYTPTVNNDSVVITFDQERRMQDLLCMILIMLHRSGFLQEMPPVLRLTRL